MILRDYQSRLVSRAEKALDTFGNTLAVGATGMGKTVCLSALVKKMDPGKAVVLQHRDELVSQNAKKFRAVNPDWRIGYFDAGTKSWAGRCTFAMVQTLHRNVDSMPALDLIVVDEAHHCVSSTYKKIIDRAKDINPDVMIAGFTATPARGDGKGMRSVFSNVCDMVTLDELVAAGFLVEPKCYVMTLAGVEDALKDVRRDKSGEYDMNEVEEVMNTTAHNKSVVREWKNVAGDRKTIVFCSTVEHSRTVCQEFERAGINAAHIDGAMPAGARKATLQAFDHGPIQVLCNCAVLTEGFDSQPVSCVILLRPCSYKSTMLQMVGRGLRTVDPELYPGVVKRDCLVLDFGASLKTHGDLSTQIRMDDREKMKQKCPECQGEIPMNVKECPLCGAVLREDSEGGRKEREIVDGKLVEFELLKKSPFRWIDLFGTTKVMFASGFNAWVSVVSPDGETWTAIGKLKGENVKKLAVAGRPQAIARADDFLRTYEESDAAKKSKRWMNDPATENQWRLLERFQYERDSLGLSMNKYQAACHMNFQFNRRAIEAAIL